LRPTVPIVSQVCRALCSCCYFCVCCCCC